MTTLRDSLGSQTPVSRNDQVTIMTEEIIHLDGRTLEGGGQRVRNAITLSTPREKAVTVSHIEGNSQRRSELKGSHAAAIRFPAKIRQGEVVKRHVGFERMAFHPRKQDPHGDLNQMFPIIKPEYTIVQDTAGFIFLVFQALYPFLIYASGLSTTTHNNAHHWWYKRCAFRLI